MPCHRLWNPNTVYIHYRGITQQDDADHATSTCMWSACGVILPSFFVCYQNYHHLQCCKTPNMTIIYYTFAPSKGSIYMQRYVHVLTKIAHHERSFGGLKFSQIIKFRRFRNLKPRPLCLGPSSVNQSISDLR